MSNSSLLPIIMLVEDEEDARFILDKALQKAGYQIFACANGSEALEILNQHKPDILITDLMMPEVGGIELLKSMANSNCLKMVITAFADKQGTIDALNHGADFLIEKPFSASSLIETVNRLWEQRSDADQQELGSLYHRRLDELHLSDNERELATLILKGAGNKRIAGVLGIQEQSVKNRLFELYRKLNISSRTELVHLIFPI